MFGVVGPADAAAAVAADADPAFEGIPVHADVVLDIVCVEEEDMK